MKRTLPIVIVVVIVAAIVYYFANKNYSNTQNNNSSDMSGMNNNNQNNSNTTPETTDKVTIEGFAFSPANITVKKGTTVTWTNQDSAAHTVTEADDKDGPNSGHLAKGQTYTFTFDTVGTYKYYCSIHPNMTGTVTVTE